MRYLIPSLIGSLSLLATSNVNADKPKKKNPIVQPINVQPARVMKGGRVTKPHVINDAKTLAKYFPTKENRRKVLKHVNFDEQYLLYFAWGGSGRDRLQATTRNGIATFVYTHGLSRDLRYHSKLFALKDGTMWKIVKGR